MATQSGMAGGGASSGLPAHPGSIRIGVGLWLATAVFGVLNAGWLWTQKSALVETIEKIPADKRVGLPDPAGIANDLLAQRTLYMVLFGIGFTVFALLLRRGKAWTRIALTVLVALAVYSLFTRLGLDPANLLWFALMAGSLVASWVPMTSQWLLEVAEVRNGK